VKNKHHKHNRCKRKKEKYMEKYVSFFVFLFLLTVVSVTNIMKVSSTVVLCVEFYLITARIGLYVHKALIMTDYIICL